MAKFRTITFRAIAYDSTGNSEVVYSVEAAYDSAPNAFVLAFQLPIEGALQTILVCGRDQTVMKTAQNETRLIYRLGAPQQGVYVTDQGKMLLGIETTEYEWSPRSVKYHYFTVLDGHRTGEHSIEIHIDELTTLIN